MRAVWIKKHGGPEVLEVRETPDPELARGRGARAGACLRTELRRSDGAAGPLSRCAQATVRGRLRRGGRRRGARSRGDRAAGRQPRHLPVDVRRPRGRGLRARRTGNGDARRDELRARRGACRSPISPRITCCFEVARLRGGEHVLDAHGGGWRRHGGAAALPHGYRRRHLRHGVGREARLMSAASAAITRSTTVPRTTSRRSSG